MFLEETTISLKTSMTAHHQNKQRERERKLKKEKWQNLKEDYTSRQKEAQEPEVRGLEVFTTKNKNHLPKGGEKVLE